MPMQRGRRQAEDPLVERLFGPVKPDATAVTPARKPAKQRLAARVKRSLGLDELADTAKYVGKTAREARKAAARRRRPPI